MNEQQQKRSDALKQCVNELNGLCHIAKRQLDRETGSRGDPIRAATWSDACMHALKALRSMHEYCGMLARSGDDPHVVIDVAQFASLFKTPAIADGTRQ
jgi:hypothetical protein